MILGETAVGETVVPLLYCSFKDGGLTSRRRSLMLYPVLDGSIFRAVPFKTLRFLKFLMSSIIGFPDQIPVKRHF